MRKPAFFRSTRFLIMTLVAVSLAALMSVVGLSAASIRQMAIDEDREVEDGLALIIQANGLKTAAINQVLLVRDYLLTGKPVFLDPRAQAAQAFQERITAFHRLPVDPRDHELLAEILRLGRRFGLLEQQAIALHRAGRAREAADLVALEGGTTKEIWLARLDELIARQREHVADLHLRVNAAEARIQLWLFLLALLTVPTTVFLGALVLFRVLTPLRELEGASRAIAAGDLAVRVRARRGDEFGEVAEAFNHMASEVEGSLTRLVHANDALRRADRHKDEFLSVVSHELRTPLSFIKGFANVLAAEIAGPLSAEQRQYVGNITTGANRMLYLVNDLLDLALMQAGKLRLSPAPMGIDEVVAEVVQTMAPLAAEKRQALTVEAVAEAEAAAGVSADRQRVAQVLTNLVANAIKFTPPDGRITVAARAEEAGGVRVEVRDTGPGIAPEDQLKLFQRFTQLDMSSTRAAGGTGLGLSISAALVEAHGGTIGVESAVGSGSTFWFSLPAEAPQG